MKPKPVTPEFTCTVPDYPDVSVSIPWTSVPAREDFCLTLKVQIFVAAVPGIATCFGATMMRFKI